MVDRNLDFSLKNGVKITKTWDDPSKIVLKCGAFPSFWQRLIGMFFTYWDLSVQNVSFRIKTRDLPITGKIGNRRDLDIKTFGKSSCFIRCFQVGMVSMVGYKECVGNLIELDLVATSTRLKY